MELARNTRPRILFINRSIVLHDDKFLLLQREPNDTYKPTKWELPGGKMDEGQHIEQALQNEIKEETGLETKITEPFAFFESYIVPSGKYAGMPFVGLVMLCRALSNAVKLSHEHIDYAWVTIETAMQYDLTEETKHSINHFKHRLP